MKNALNIENHAVYKNDTFNMIFSPENVNLISNDIKVVRVANLFERCFNKYTMTINIHMHKTISFYFTGISFIKTFWKIQTLSLMNINNIYIVKYA